MTRLRRASSSWQQTRPNPAPCDPRASLQTLPTQESRPRKPGTKANQRPGDAKTALSFQAPRAIRIRPIDRGQAARRRTRPLWARPCAAPGLCSSCSQIRITLQPAQRNHFVTSRSRARLARSFRRQNSLPVLCAGPFLGPCGVVTGMELFRNQRSGGAWAGHPCQKHPSTNTATRWRGNTKSGRTRRTPPRDRRTRISTCLRHPRIPACRSNLTSASSVSRLPRDRMRAITAARLAMVNTPGMAHIHPLGSLAENEEV